MTKAVLSNLFKAIDLDGDNGISVNELAVWIQGAKLTREERIQKTDPEVLKTIDQSIKDLFNMFNTGKGITANDLFNMMKAYGPVRIEDAQAMIAQHDKDGNGSLDLGEFKLIM